ncbi:hypothetical protein E2C01_044153 [Portunus trituberculatus]|uniref:Uncharacterized protein n=1 Tax=Portunus trituberculatus TaxID=210409 RepID=A0A5B7FY29_PORTR|nr:hypothetical protein [Portunus trituberculatus]
MKVTTSRRSMTETLIRFNAPRLASPRLEPPCHAFAQDTEAEGDR